MKTICQIPAIIIFLCLFATFIEAVEKSPVDISLMIADFKYSADTGVKICEIQPASASRFHCVEYVQEDKEFIPKAVYNLLSIFQNNGWIINDKIRDPLFAKVFSENGWTVVPKLKNLKSDKKFRRHAKMSAKDPHNLLDYHGIVYLRTRALGALEKFRTTYPGVVVIDAATLPSIKDKYTSSILFRGDKRTEKVKPKWERYRKKYTKLLAHTIFQDIGSDVFVIKPVNQTKGNGVIIVHKNDLDTTLQYILKDLNSAKKHTDPSYQFWSSNTNQHFIVEEFVASDPIQAKHLKNLPYDPTGRVVFALVYHQHDPQVFFLEGVWKLPPKSLTEKGDLNEIHKTECGAPFYYAMDPVIQEEIYSQLKVPLTIIYKKMLGINTPNN